MNESFWFEKRSLYEVITFTEIFLAVAIDRASIGLDFWLISFDVSVSQHPTTKSLEETGCSAQ